MGFKKLDLDDLVISTDSVSATVWSNNAPSLQGYHTSSTQVSSNQGDFYYNVYQTASTDTTAAVQFSIAYCDVKGSGSAYYNSLVAGASPSRTNYGQYRTLVLGDENANFMFGTETGSYFYAINVERARYKEKLLPGTMTLHLNNGSNTISITDDSQIQTSTTFTDAGRVYNLISGSAGTITSSPKESNGFTNGSGSYGMFLPDVGLILLSGPALDGNGGDGGIELATERNPNDATDENPEKLFNAVSSSGASGNGFLLNSEETLASDFIFVRARNSEFNYSENPSFISGSTGAVLFSEFENNPRTYITTVGLYNDNNELLAVAKLSRPLLKDFTKELLVRVKLDF
tara:strand:- start:13053 stop:14090 length:1038 start_codon:yes stop_codon:yes gene_type:complete